jgi:hypothetical protein
MSSPIIVTVKTDSNCIDTTPDIKSKSVTTEQFVQYTILNYFDEISFTHDQTKRFYNSVVIDPETRKILSIGSPRAYDFALFRKVYPVCDDSIVVEEMVEGVSIQLFYEFRTGKWEIATRNAVGGNYAYYRLPGQTSMTYRNMLFDAMGLKENRQIEQWPGCQYLLTSNCYHFILRHPENHIILKTKTPQLHFVGHTELHCNNVTNDVQYHSAQGHSVFPYLSFLVKTPKTITSLHTNDEEPALYEEFLQERKKDVVIRMGVSFLNKNTGERSFVISTEYKNLQMIRGTHPNLLYQYICLQRIDKISDFLKHFPQYKRTFHIFRDMYDILIRDIHQSYIQFYIRKSNMVIDKSISFHIHHIHSNIYKPSLNNVVKTIIKKEIVREYVNTLEPGCILHMIQREKYKEANLVRDL